MPDQDAVLAITGAVPNEDMQALLDLVWQHLLPAMRDAPLPADAAAQAALVAKLAALNIPPVQGTAFSPVAATVSGQRYSMPANQENIHTFRLELTADGATLTIGHSDGDVKVKALHGGWYKPTTSLAPFDPLNQRQRLPAAASGARTAEDTYTFRVCVYETPFCPTLTLRFADHRLYYSYMLNVGPEPLARPQVVGRKVS